MNYTYLIDLYRSLAESTAFPSRNAAQNVNRMLRKIDPAWPEDKLNRWIGFIQGVLWSQGICDIDQLREHVRIANGKSTTLNREN